MTSVVTIGTRAPAARVAPVPWPAVAGFVAFALAGRFRIQPSLPVPAEPGATARTV